jgi:hypothetical protein
LVYGVICNVLFSIFPISSSDKLWIGFNTCNILIHCPKPEVLTRSQSPTPRFTVWNKFYLSFCYFFTSEHSVLSHMECMYTSKRSVFWLWSIIIKWTWWKFVTRRSNVMDVWIDGKTTLIVSKTLSYTASSFTSTVRVRSAIFLELNSITFICTTYSCLYSSILIFNLLDYWWFGSIMCCKIEISWILKSITKPIKASFIMIKTVFIMSWIIPLIYIHIVRICVKIALSWIAILITSSNFSWSTFINSIDLYMNWKFLCSHETTTHCFRSVFRL